MGIGVNRLKQGDKVIALSDNGLNTKVFYAADNAYGTNNGKVFDVNVVGNNSLPWFVSGSEGYITWDVTHSYQQWSGSNPSGVTLSGDLAGNNIGDTLSVAGLSASFDSQNLTGASQSYNLDIKAGDLTTIDNSYFVHDQAVEANYTRYDFSELATYQPYSLNPSYVQAVSASLIYPTGTNPSVYQNLTGKTKTNLTVDNYSNITSSMNGRLVLDMDGESPLFQDTGTTSTINLATGSVFIVFNNPAPTAGTFISVGREDMNSTSNWYYINYNNGKPQAVNVARWSTYTLSPYSVSDSVLTAGNMVSIHHDITGVTTGSGGTMYYDGALCENLTGNWNLYSSNPSGGSPSDSGTQSGDRYIGQGFFTNDGWLGNALDARTTNNGLLIGARKNSTTGTQDQYTGDIAEIRIYNRVLTTDEIAVVHRELAYKWGFSLQ